jgi:hypothetical protein
MQVVYRGTVLQRRGPEAVRKGWCARSLQKVVVAGKAVVCCRQLRCDESSTATVTHPAETPVSDGPSTCTGLLTSLRDRFTLLSGPTQQAPASSARRSCHTYSRVSFKPFHRCSAHVRYNNKKRQTGSTVRKLSLFSSTPPDSTLILLHRTLHTIHETDCELPRPMPRDSQRHRHESAAYQILSSQIQHDHHPTDAWRRRPRHPIAILSTSL